MARIERLLGGACLCALSLLLLVDAAHARTESLRWQQASASQVTGFEILVGSSSGNYVQVIDAGRPSPQAGIFRYDLSVADDADVYVAVRAYDAAGLRSAASNEQLRLAPTGGGSGGSGSGGSGSGGSGSGSGGSGSGSGGSGSGSGGSGGGGSTEIVFPALPEDPGFATPRAFLVEDFESASLGSSVRNWVDTGADSSLAEDDSLFAVESHSGNRVLATSSNQTGVHSHYQADGSDGWSDYLVHGAFGISSTNGRIGFTALSQFGASSAYYGLLRADSGAMELVLPAGIDCGNASTGVVPLPDRWYRFRMSLDQVGSSVRVRARVWRAGRSEPTSWQAECTDARSGRLRSGTVGVWSAGPGKKFWDEIQVVPRVASPPPAEPAVDLLAPAAGTVLGGANVDFSWTDANGQVGEWWLSLGSSAGGTDLFDSGNLGGQTSVRVRGLPTDGRRVHATLWYRVSGSSWESIPAQFDAAYAAPPSIVSPAAGSTLSTDQIFRWSDGAGATNEFWLYLGSTPGGRDLFDSGNLGASRSVEASLPTDGRTIHARLFYRVGGGWHFQDTTFTAMTAGDPGTGFQITSPAPGSTLPGAVTTFEWSGSGGASEWWLNLGTSPGANDLLNSGSLGSATSLAVGGLPTQGQTIHARLWVRSGGGDWVSRDYSFQAATLVQAASPGMLAPTEGSRLGPVETFSWTDPTGLVTEWWLYVGTSVGGDEVIDSGSLGGSKSLSVRNLPMTGETIHVRLWYRSGRGDWLHSDYSYQSAAAPPAILAPFPGTELEASEPFSWSDPTGAVTEWWLDLGTSLGDDDVFSSGSLGTSTSVQVPGIPAGGETLHARLWYRVGGVWASSDFTYTTRGPALTSPTPGSRLEGSSAQFRWSDPTGRVRDWWIHLGSSPGAQDVYNSGSLGRVGSTQVSGLPTDGRTLHLRLWFETSSGWHSKDYTFRAAR